jgi:hypothetical protein
VFCDYVRIIKNGKSDIDRFRSEKIRYIDSLEKRGDIGENRCKISYGCFVGCWFVYAVTCLPDVRHGKSLLGLMGSLLLAVSFLLAFTKHFGWPFAALSVAGSLCIVADAFLSKRSR